MSTFVTLMDLALCQFVHKHSLTHKYWDIYILESFLYWSVFSYSLRRMISKIIAVNSLWLTKVKKKVVHTAKVMKTTKQFLIGKVYFFLQWCWRELRLYIYLHNIRIINHGSLLCTVACSNPLLFTVAYSCPLSWLQNIIC